MKRYPPVSSNTWVQPKKRDYRLACCDCGLIHSFDFRIYRGRVQIRGHRNNRATAAYRRNKRFMLIDNRKETP